MITYKKKKKKLNERFEWIDGRYYKPLSLQGSKITNKIWLTNSLLLFVSKQKPLAKT